MTNRRLSPALAAFALAGALSFARPSLAYASNDSDLATAENAYAALDYASALTASEQVLTHGGLSHDLLTRATRVAGLASAAMGKVDAAKQYFTQLLEYDPTFRVDARLGPRFSEPFAEARGFWQAQGQKPGLEVTATVSFGQPGRIQYSTRDPLNIVKKVMVSYRWAPARDYTTVSVTPGQSNVDTEPNPEGSRRFEYYVHAVDGNDRVIFEDGAVENPKTTVVEAPREQVVGGEKKSIFASPIFWTAAGVVVAGAVVGGYFLFRPTDYTSSGRSRGTFAAMCGTTACD